jgi:hypothetical protein
VTLREVQDECWDSIPRLRRRIVGRAMVDDLVVQTLLRWDSSSDIEGSMRCYGEQRYGSIIWMIVWQAAISAVVQWLINRWLERRHEAASLRAEALSWTPPTGR